MLIAQISDPHIVGRHKKAFGIAPTAENLGRCVDHVNQLSPEPDLVLVTGDVTNTGLLAETEQAASLLAALRCPFYVIPGNHDDRSNFWAVFGEGACPARYQGFVNYVIEGLDIRLIALDSMVPGHSGGEICRTRAAWLEQRLAEAGAKPTIIFMHHPPVRCGVPETDIDGFEGAERLGDIVEKYANIERIICGHIHLPAHVRWRGTVVSTAPSVSMQLVLDLTGGRDSQFVLDAPGYQLHHWTPDANLVTHTIHLGRADSRGPFLFEEHDEADP